MELAELRLLPRAAVSAPPSAPAPAFERPAPKPVGLSLGPTNAGALSAAMPLPTTHPHLSIRATTLARRAYFGTPSLVTALTNAAARIARDYPGSVLWAGDLSLEAGGAFAPHASHTNGRDADLAFYVSEAGPDGLRPADGGAMQVVSADGRVGSKRFDVARNWALVRALLEDPHISVQWVFVASHLRALLLDQARREDPELAARAERVLAQPGDSSPHADHFHVRIYCGLEERLEGCLDAPPFHPFADRHDAALTAWLEGLLPFLATPHLPETRDAIEHIVRMNATQAIPHLVALADRLASPEVAARTPDGPELARLAGDALAFLRGQRTPSAWKQWRALDVGD
ncbi:MAG: penicillin-insensitive murein endopeptidase [Deltaproteobacteria bacterium]|nr:penicillin-insensitive murein endopeptidase [Deltaproteobacteria bacterium]